MKRRGLAILLTLGLVVGACSNTNNQDQIELVVSAASSLMDAFTDIASAFEAANPDVDLQLNLGGSSAIREQILAGSPADVFASADPENIDVLKAEGWIEGDPIIFTTSSMRIAVPASNPGGVTGLHDFDNESLLIGLCAESVPCGRYARQIFTNAGIEPKVDTNEPDVRSLLAKIGSNDLDAGVVYQTDISASDGAVASIDIPPDLNVTAVFTIAVVADSDHQDEANLFVHFVLSEAGQVILRKYGFDTP